MRFALFLILAAPALAWAHPGHGDGGFWPGLLHPFSGADHLLAMVAVGLWAARMGGRARWAVPLAFVLAMLAGAAAGFAGVQVPAVESMVAASVLVLGLLVATGVRPGAVVGAAVCALFAVFHGLAHAAELPVGATALAYGAGFALATALLHASGVFTGLWMQKRWRAAPWVGAPIALAGCVMLGQAVLN
jgi:urease accessory protein